MILLSKKSTKNCLKQKKMHENPLIRTRDMTKNVKINLFKLKIGPLSLLEC